MLGGGNSISQQIWIIPGQRMKGGIAHIVPLTEEMLVLLSSLPRFNEGDHLFSTTLGRGPVSGFSKVKRRIDRRMLLAWRALGRIERRNRGVLAPWVNHDIRRTVRTHLSALPVTDLVRELVIAHAKPGLHKVYDQYAYLDEKRQALSLWGRRLTSIVEPSSMGNVVVSLRAPL
jgi:integrase